MAEDRVIQVSSRDLKVCAAMFALVGCSSLLETLRMFGSPTGGAWVGSVIVGGAALLFAGALYVYDESRELRISPDEGRITLSTLVTGRDIPFTDVLCVLVSVKPHPLGFRFGGPTNRIYVVAILDKKEQPITELPPCKTYDEAVRKAGTLAGLLSTKAIDDTGIKQEGLRQLPVVERPD